MECYGEKENDNGGSGEDDDDEDDTKCGKGETGRTDCCGETLFSHG